MALIEVRDLHKSFGDTVVLDGVSMSVEKGDVIAVLGPSGGGKTTLLRCINFLETADSGSLVFDGVTHDMAHITKKQISEIRLHTGFVFQNYNLFRNKTALQNVTEGLLIARHMDKAEAEEKGMRMLEKVGMADRASHYPSQLSGGQQQRVAIARALVNDPQLIIADEPTGNIDPELSYEIVELLKGINDQGTTILMVTHEHDLVRHFG
jgi:cystine transport system ATP-binding protein/L-cystine transport system ATP-binding protein